jgi:hypothetical protein
MSMISAALEPLKSIVSVSAWPSRVSLPSPPLALRTSVSEVPMSLANGAGSRRSNRAGAPLAVVVNCSAPPPPLTSTVSVPAPPSLRSVSSPGFQIVVAGVPDHPVVAALAEGLIVAVAAGEGVVLVTAGEDVEADTAQEGVDAGLAEEVVGTGAAGESVVVATAEQVRPRQRAVGLVEADRVVAGPAEDLDQRGVGHRGRATDHDDGAVVHQDLFQPHRG